MEEKNCKVRMALIGVGVMGRKYAEMICGGQVPGMCLTAVVCRNDEARGWAQKLPAGPQIYESAEALYEHADQYDAVLIVTPHKTHPELAKQAFALGKHVLCDKPAGICVSQANEMNQAALKAGKMYGMVFHQRLYPKYRKIRELLQRRELGDLSRIMLVNSRYFRTRAYHQSGSWRSSWNGEGGGALINQGQHILDIWQWLFGIPERLYADIPFGKYNDFRVDDEVTIQMHYKNLVTGVLVLTTGEAIWEERLEVIGSRGKVLLEDDTLHIWRYSDDSNRYLETARSNSREGLEVTEEVIEFEKQEEPYPELLKNFAEAVLTGNRDKLTAKGDEAAYPLMLTNAAYLSAWQERPVEFPMDNALYDTLLEYHCAREEESLGVRK